MSIVGLFVNAGVGANVVRVFRIARAFRLLKKAKALNALFQTLVMSIPSLWNIGSLLFVMFFIFAVLGTCREPCCRRSCLLSPWLGAWVSCCALTYTRSCCLSRAGVNFFGADPINQAFEGDDTKYVERLPLGPC
jgi:hypothetical protein